MVFNAMLQNIVTSFLAFASTNIDDLFILMLLYGSHQYKPSHIITGQYLGISTLVIIALAASFIGAFIDTRYIGLLGLFPVYLGLKQVYELITKQAEESGDQVNLPGKGSDIIAIATLTIANGGDNIGIYVPLLTTLSYIEKIGLVVVFIIMVFVWCQAAKYLAAHPLMAKTLNKYAHVIMPIVLLLLGILIITESRTLTLLNDLPGL
jgi:cadmium resistance transport/sequestration family protein